jgi:AmmeMemoRadiSam system protein A
VCAAESPETLDSDGTETAERARRGGLLLVLARQALELRWSAGGARHRQVPLPATPSSGRESWLSIPGASFVSLDLQGELRGCIGTVEPYRPLVDDVSSNAVRAAFEDPRFAPLARHELEVVRIEVSVLGTLEALGATTLEAAAAELRPGRDGVLLTLDGMRATLLPQVWEAVPDPMDFVLALARKAGFAQLADLPTHGIRLHRYRVDSWRE